MSIIAGKGKQGNTLLNGKGGASGNPDNLPGANPASKFLGGGGAGSEITSPGTGRGGAGRLSVITGEYYGGGGGGSGYNELSAPSGNGGTGGGGNGGKKTGTYTAIGPTEGAANTGGGGGGAILYNDGTGYYNRMPAAPATNIGSYGGSGIIVVRLVKPGIVI